MRDLWAQGALSGDGRRRVGRDLRGRPGRRVALLGLPMLGLGVLGLALAGCGGSPPRYGAVAGQLPPIPPGRGRIYVYRYMDPYEALAWTTVYFNGQAVGAARPSAVFYRDVAAGSYSVTAHTELYQPDQVRRLEVAAGQTSYIKVIAIPTPTGAQDGTDSYTSFVLQVVDQATGAREIQNLGFVAS